MHHRKTNLSAITEYFASGCKHEKLLGLELEHFVVDRETRRSLPYENGVETLLSRLQPLYGEPILSPEDRIIGIIRKDAHITLEPAAQLEISIAPSQELAQIERVYNEFIKILSPLLHDMGCELVCAGYHPKSKINELPMIPKQRYKYMEQYLKSTGTRGIYMMKGSAATQVSIDYKDEADFMKKFRVANILGPLLALICENTPVFEGEPFIGNMVRTHIWNDVDPDRSMVVRGALDGTFGFHEYAEYVYSIPAVFITREDETIFTGATPASALFSEQEMTRQDIEHITSMMFPDVCLKNHIEIRTADSMPIPYALAYLALLKGIMYDAENLDKLHERTRDIRNRDVVLAKEALMKNGADGQAYGERAAAWIIRLFKMAGNGLCAEEKKYLLPIKEKWL